jgi:uncharacterized membrane protein (UPF0136 family)
MLAYAALLIVGGLMGYLKAKSIQSLVTSLAAAAAIFGGVFVARANPSVGYGICGAVALALAIFFAYRVYGGSIMPGLPALLLSLAAVGLLAFAHFSAK